MTAVDSIFPVIFLGALIIVRQARLSVTHIDHDCYRKLSIGVSLLAVLSVLNLFHKQGVLASLRFSDTFWIEFTGWMTALVGVSFVASGVSGWMPLIRRFRIEMTDRNCNLEFLARVQEAADNRELSLKTVLSQAVRDIAHTYRFGSYAVITYANGARRNAVKLIDRSNTRKAHNFCSLAEFDKTAFLSILENDSDSLTQNLYSGGKRSADYPDLIVPIEVNNRRVGCYLLWGGKGTRTEETMSALYDSAAIVARRIEREHFAQKSTALMRHASLIEKLNETGKGRGAAELLPLLHGALSEQMSLAATVTATVEESVKKLNRMTVGSTGSVLLERNLRLDQHWGEGSFGHMADFGLVKNIAALSGRVEVLAKTLVPYCSHGSLFYQLFPLCDNRVGIIGFYSECSGGFDNSDTQLFRSLRSLVGEALMREDSIDRVERNIDESVSFSNFSTLVKGLSAAGGTKEGLQGVTSHLLEINEIKSARISLIDEGRFLESVALSTRNLSENSLPANGIQILSLMPGHEQVLRTGEPLVIGDQSAEMYCSAGESAQMLDGSIASALICPIPAGDSVVGTLTLMSDDPTGQPFHSSETVGYIAAIAGIVGMSLIGQQYERHVGRPLAAVPVAANRFGKDFGSHTSGVGRDGLAEIKAPLSE